MKKYLEFIKESIDQEEIRNIFNDFMDEFGFNSNRVIIKNDSSNKRLLFMIEIKEGVKIAFRIGRSTKKDEFIRILYLGVFTGSPNMLDLHHIENFDEYVEIINVISDRMIENKYELDKIKGKGIEDQIYICFEFKKLD